MPFSRSVTLAGVLSLLNVVFLAGMALLLAPVFAGPDPSWALSFAPSLALMSLLALPLVATGLTVGLLVQTGIAWYLGLDAGR